MTFHVGQKVVCINIDHITNRKAETGNDAYDFLTLGKTYTIRWIGDTPHPTDRSICSVAVRLSGIVRPEHPNSDYCDMPFLACRFRPLIENKDQSFFMTGAPKDSEKWDNRKKIRRKVKENA